MSGKNVLKPPTFKSNGDIEAGYSTPNTMIFRDKKSDKISTSYSSWKKKSFQKLNIDSDVSELIGNSILNPKRTAVNS